ncbi:hypothetical protein SAMN05192553_101502 [Cyclobacterium xiamenense]|uniref:Uncharacterized protein n=1 Tax=Cyclobacterium xiamenense TaxID=1297121 RepID=A0A1H6U8S5_9BACT|nr:hypothetical protein SAMN05192553_101502 [Cyclobacterium xiamenense]
MNWHLETHANPLRALIARVEEFFDTFGGNFILYVYRKWPHFVEFIFPDGTIHTWQELAPWIFQVARGSTSLSLTSSL